MSGLVFSGGIAASTPDGELAELDTQHLGEWVQQMKANPRGPFRRIRWFCNDGSVLPPRSYGCKTHGGGVQHGEWSDQTREIRTAGYLIANVLADLKPRQFTDGEAGANLFRFLLLEQYLIAVDNGWILRRARFYRGAFQAEGEHNAAVRILQATLWDPEWRERRFLLAYEGVRLLAHGAATVSQVQIRNVATSLHRRDPGFETLRNKIHARPDAGDGQRVRYFAGNGGVEELREEYFRLAEEIDAAWAVGAASDMIRRLMCRITDRGLIEALEEAAGELQGSTTAGERLRISSSLLAVLRDRLPTISDQAAMLAAMDLALVLEQEAFTAGQELIQGMGSRSRAERFSWLANTARALYGTGLLTRREWHQISRSVADLHHASMPLEQYRAEVDYLARVPVWATRRLEFHFGPVMQQLAEIEPIAAGYIADRLRGSLALFYSSVLETLEHDAHLLSGTRHDFFGEPVYTGLRALNAGVAYGVLRSIDDTDVPIRTDTPVILIVPETLADLPPVAGILTANEGNRLSHVQLLARNMGLPNVVVSKALMPGLLAHRGRLIIFAVGAGGIVHLQEVQPGSRAEYDRGRQQAIPVRIQANFNKLDLSILRPLPVSKLRASDSGVTVGPKAAQLGELTGRFPDAVSPGLAIPFGVFRKMLDRPFEPNGTSIFEWMKAQYADLAAITESREKKAREHQFLQKLRERIMESGLNSEFEAELRQAMERQFGPDGSYGVFVRSDTNVEDLPGFTGAGLNLTVSNVVGFENVVQAVKAVWASPFTERAYGWRQALMDNPEHVYAAVLLHKSVAVEKSGVMITADIDSGARDVLSVVVNEGVGGGVEGQSAESLRIALTSGAVRLLASATATNKRVLLAAGGSQLVPARGAERVLEDDEIRDLRSLARQLPDWFSRQPGRPPSPRSADVEFGFLNGRLVLFQIRPFVDNHAISTRTGVSGTESSAAGVMQLRVVLAEKPLGDIQ